MLEIGAFYSIGKTDATRSYTVSVSTLNVGDIVAKTTDSLALCQADTDIALGVVQAVTPTNTSGQFIVDVAISGEVITNNTSGTIGTIKNGRALVVAKVDTTAANGVCVVRL